MPVDDLGYRPWEGRLDASKPFWVIAKTGIRLQWRKGMIPLLLIAWLPWLVRAIQILIRNRLSQASAFEGLAGQLEIDPAFFDSFWNGQSFFLLLVLAVVGSSLIAKEREHHALGLYFSRPVSMPDYLVGKLLVLGFYAALVTLFPALLLFLLQILFTTDPHYFHAAFWIPLFLVAVFLIDLFVLGGLILAWSALTSPGIAAVLFFATLWIPELVRNLLRRIPIVGILSIEADLRQVSAALFGVERPLDLPMSLVIVVLVAYLGLWAGILKHRIRPVETTR